MLSGEKNSTWRLWDDKNLREGDFLDFLNSKTGNIFATAKVTKVVEKPLGQLNREDKLGHESFSSDKKMYETYSKYYQKEVNPKTTVKIIWFDLTKKLKEK